MKKWSSDRWISIVAIVASLGTLFTIIYQTDIFRKQQYASVLPYLELWNSSNNDSYRLILINNGIGPAFIEEVSILYKDSVYQLDPAEFTRNVVDPIDTITRFGHSNIRKGRLVPAGTQINLVQALDDSTNATKLWSWFSGGDTTRVHRPEIEIIYASVYGERWKIQKYGTDQPIKLD
ncbi:hypothetical protein SAMN05421640_1376 [Ekhidna lutea]|uniref:Uncharacterized protein n=1 Tax=Ekhidna lutea TaxID=447679 RepID=A0A239HP93_EKHLU|nr:hypothetical protein [Ekhidna lutea]SNS82074.1 hypothetical protein SAMN05421640_1376 [Ekhidna lutea]